MKIDLDAVYTGQVSYAEMMHEVQHADLYRITDELFDALKSILAKATDGAVHFVPSDPTASDHSEQGWTLSHVVTHLTATLEEAAATNLGCRSSCRMGDRGILCTGAHSRCGLI